MVRTGTKHQRNGCAGGVTVAIVREGARGAGVEPRLITYNSELDPFDHLIYVVVVTSLPLPKHTLERRKGNSVPLFLSVGFDDSSNKPAW